MDEQTQWQLHQSEHPCEYASLLVSPVFAVVLGAADALPLGAEPPLFVPDPPPCSEAPLSLPQLFVYHVLIAVLSLGFVQDEAHIVVNAPPEPVHTVWQKHDQAARDVLDPPLQDD